MHTILNMRILLFATVCCVLLVAIYASHPRQKWGHHGDDQSPRGRGFGRGKHMGRMRSRGGGGKHRNRGMKYFGGFQDKESHQETPEKPIEVQIGQLSDDLVKACIASCSEECEEFNLCVDENCSGMPFIMSMIECGDCNQRLLHESGCGQCAENCKSKTEVCVEETCPSVCAFALLMGDGDDTDRDDGDDSDTDDGDDSDTDDDDDNDTDDGDDSDTNDGDDNDTDDGDDNDTDDDDDNDTDDSDDSDTDDSDDNDTDDDDDRDTRSRNGRVHWGFRNRNEEEDSYRGRGYRGMGRTHGRGYSDRNRRIKLPVEFDKASCLSCVSTCKTGNEKVAPSASPQHTSTPPPPEILEEPTIFVEEVPPEAGNQNTLVEP